MDCEKIALPTKAKVHQYTMKLVECDSVETTLSIRMRTTSRTLITKEYELLMYMKLMTSS